ncbi:hypothetical protein PS627_03286 [Pseudomonas fluorescens]|uniref:DUF1161 domain-containing protein n=1 Tax=Pseudomonas fluorescens TaxID=294 RepID=UPI00125137F5|nr:DUF1161 domain-containing protein [Pseudomonas fluorescens]CAG8868921.1 hypothetical protein PS627_03286 [Pseudomonas fluorescens]
MKKMILALGLMTMAGSVLAAGTPCEAIKAEIAGKLDAKGVQGYTLEVVDQGTPAGKVVGSCEAGSKEIVYRRD